MLTFSVNYMKLALAAFIFLWLSSSLSEAGLVFNPNQTRVIDRIPTDLVLSDDFVFVIGAMKDRGTLIKLDRLNLEEKSRTELEFIPRRILLSPDQDYIILVGDREGKFRNGSSILKSMALILDLDLNVINTIPFQRQFAYPTLFLSSNHQLLVVGQRTDTSEGAYVSLDVSKPARAYLTNAVRLSLANLNLNGLWLSSEEGVLFLNSADTELLQAVKLPGELAVSSITNVSDSLFISNSFSVSAALVDPTCAGADQTRFLVANARKQTLEFSVYNELARSLDILASIDVSLKFGSLRGELLPGTNLVRPAMIVTNSCDMSTIMLSSIYSNEMIQYSLNPTFLTLERIRSIPLAFRPRRIEISPDGETAYILSENTNFISYYSLKVQKESSNELGDDKIREIQRLLNSVGLNVGAIDGLVGAKTYKALSAVERIYDVQLDLRDTAKTLDTLQTLVRNKKM
ncbi:hypothetical protein [Pararhizobium sp. O133]|uniref:hypothetical protein n=1 Tax=Pararhizobium sp. O133 TaxID=3449278 RepID=UPI003F684141